MDAKSIWIPTIERTNYSTTHNMIPNLSNAATSNKNLYVKKKKKKEPVKYKGNRANIPNLSNAATSNKDTFKPKGDKSKTKTKTKSKLSGKKRAQELARKRIGKGTARNPDTTIAQINARNKQKMRDRATAKNTDFKKVRSGDMSKAAFEKKYKRNTSSRPTVSSNKKTDKPYKKLTDKEFNKKFDVKKGDSKFKKFTKSGALLGLLNRRLKISRSKTKEDFLLRKKKKK